MQRNCLFMTAASGRAQKDSMHASYICSEYLCLPVKTNQEKSCQHAAETRTLKLEREVIRQVTTFMIAAKEEEGIRVPNLERP